MNRRIISQQIILRVVKYPAILKYQHKCHKYTLYTYRSRPYSNFCLLTVTRVAQRKQLYFRVKDCGVISELDL